MTKRTIDLLLNLEAKPKSVDVLIKRFKELEKSAEETKRMIKEATDPKEFNRAAQSLNNIEREMAEINAEAQKRTLEKTLKASAEQANKTRERMEKIAQVGARLAVTGGLILSPFILALKKYQDMAAEDDPMAKRLRGVSEQLQAMQVRLGKVVAEEVLPLLERALPYVDKMITWLEKNPDFVKVAMGIGGTLIAAGGIMSAIGTIGSTISTLQGLGLAGGAGGVLAGGAGMTSTIAAGFSAAAPVLASAMYAALPYVAIAAAVVLAAEGTRRLVNWATGTNTTWADIGNTLKQLLFISGEGWKSIPNQLKTVWGDNIRQYREIQTKVAQLILNGIRNLIGSLANAIKNGFTSFGSSIKSAFGSFANAIGIKPVKGYAEGGYLKKEGLFRGAEDGREFVLSNQATRAAEKAVGGKLTQERVIRSLTSSGGSLTLNDNRRFNSDIPISVRRQIRDEAMGDMRKLLGAIG